MSGHISQEDEDLKRAIAESLGQIYIPQQYTTQESNKVETNDWSKRTDFTGIKLIGYLCDSGEVIQGDCLRQNKDKIFVHFNTDAGHYGKKHDWISIPNERICPPPTNRPKQRSIGQQMNTIYNHEKYKQKTSTNTQSVPYEEEFIEQSLVTYEDAVNMLLNGNCCFGLYDKKIKRWRTVVFMKKWDHAQRLMVRFTLETNINPGSGSDKFLTIKHFPVNYIILNDNEKFNVKERDLKDMSNVPKANIDLWVIEKKERQKQWIETQQKKQCEILVDGYIKDQKKKQYIVMIHPGLNKIIAHYCCLLFYGVPIIIDDNNKKQRRDIKCNFNDNDWSKRTDFTGVKLIGYLCDDGEVIQGDCLRQKSGYSGPIFVHFNTDAGHYGKTHDWIPVPNERICPPPKNRAKQRRNYTYTYDYGSNYDINNEDDDDLQRAIAASLNDINNPK